MFKQLLTCLFNLMVKTLLKLTLSASTSEIMSLMSLPSCIPKSFNACSNSSLEINLRPIKLKI